MSPPHPSDRRKELWRAAGIAPNANNAYVGVVATLNVRHLQAFIDELYGGNKPKT